MAAAALLLLLAAPAAVPAFYLPGVAPKSFREGDPVALKVDKLTSVKSQLPFSYYHLPFCSPAEAGIVDSETGAAAKIVNSADNLGEVLAGDRMESTGYRLNMKEHTSGCEILCRKVFTAEESDRLVEFIGNDYRVNMWVDNLPAAQKFFVSQEAMMADMDHMDSMHNGDETRHPDKESYVISRGYRVGNAHTPPEQAIHTDDDLAGSLSLAAADAAVDVHDVDHNGLSAGEFSINNHLQFIIRYHEADNGLGDFGVDAATGGDDTQQYSMGQGGPSGGQGFSGARIVGFEVVPTSVQHRWTKKWNGANTYLSTCNGQNLPGAHDPLQKLAPGAENEVVFTYRTVWYKDTHTKWADRWNIYFQDQDRDTEIHWFSIFNSLLIVVFLSSMVAFIMMRALYRDIEVYNQDEADDLLEETGWKLVHGDVFRPPAVMPMVLSVFVGAGHQLIIMTFVMLVFACLGFLSPANRGGLVTALVFLFVFAGTVSGYKASRLYKLFAGTDWRGVSLLSALLLPGGVFAIAFLLNLLIWARGSTGALPFGTIIVLVLLWFGISVPLTFVGSYFGFAKDAYELPCKAHQIPRQIPEQQWYMHPLVTTVAGGILPFGGIFIEVFFIMSALWMHTIYYVFGFLFLVLIILGVCSAEVAIVICYFQLSAEDYTWWWRSFMTSASTGGYLFLYSAVFFNSKLDLADFTSGALYFGYMGLVSGAFSLLTGSIGFEACFWFTRKMFGAIKVD